MKTKILQRLENYKKHRQECIGKNQATEMLFTTKILELEWVLGLLETES